MLAISEKHKEEIVDTAFSLFHQYGYNGVSVRQICEKANVPRSSFYTIFSGKEDIMVYSLSRVKGNFEKSMHEFIMAENDLERIWFLTDSFLHQAVSVGPDLCKVYFILEINGKCELFNILADFNDWLIRLLANCQKNGIVLVKGKPEELIPMQLNLAKALLFDWVRSNGAFTLRETVRSNIEIFLDVPEEYRHKNKLTDCPHKKPYSSN